MANNPFCPPMLSVPVYPVKSKLLMEMSDETVASASAPEPDPFIDKSYPAPEIFPPPTQSSNTTVQFDPEFEALTKGFEGFSGRFHFL